MWFQQHLVECRDGCLSCWCFVYVSCKTELSAFMSLGGAMQVAVCMCCGLAMSLRGGAARDCVAHGVRGIAAPKAYWCWSGRDRISASTLSH